MNIAYEALTPSILEGEKAQSYIEALNFACSRADIRNIAVTGPYGAGKSSVLLTWQKAEDNDFRVMTVSLADFEMQQASPVEPGTGDGKGESDNAEKKAAKAEEKTIEYSILQQLLYKEKKSVLPYSRLERISDVSGRQIVAMAASLLLILMSAVTGLLFLFPDYIRTKLSLPPELSQSLLALPVIARLGGAGIFLFAALFLTLKKLHRTGVFDRRVSIDKVDVMKGAISTRPAAPSLLNVYIDEIVYFFEKTQYNVVIFEDLDRHNDGAIFIKLREINQLINNCFPADKPVRFIYAVRDNLFNTPESRTKFFDFVMPVIPVMDSENASEHFIGKFTPEELGQDGFRECLSRMALFIPDMRVMHNIANEFRLYRNIVNNGEDLKRLVSLIAYKNLCAEDYHGIDHKRGLLYSIVIDHISGKLRDVYSNTLKARMESYQSELSLLQKENLLSEQELRREILLPYISEKTEANLFFLLDTGTQYDLEEVVEDENAFQALFECANIYIRSRRSNANMAIIDKKSINQIKATYEDRCAIIRNKSDGSIDRLAEQTESIRHEIQRTLSYDLAFFINKMSNSGFREWAARCAADSHNTTIAPPDNIGNIDFLYFLLSLGYLSTDYMSYRSVFMPGTLSTEDNNFIRAVTAGRAPNETAEMPLSNIANTLKKLRELGMLMHDNAWHPQLLLHLLHNDTIPLKTIMEMQTGRGEEHRMIRLANDIFPLWKPATQRTYMQFMVAGDGHLSAMLRQLRRLNDISAQHTLLPLLMSLPVLPWESVSADMREILQQLIDAHFDLAAVLPENGAQFFCENLRESKCQLTHIPLIGSNTGRKVLRSVAAEKLWSYSTSNLQNLYYSLTRDLKNSSKIFRKNPINSLRALQISNIETCVNENITSFLREIFIHADESELIPEFLNSEIITWDDIEYITSDMKFVLEDVTTITNKANAATGAASNNTLHNLYSLLTHHNHIAPAWLNVMVLLDQDAKVPGDIICEWLNNNYRSLPDEAHSLTETLFPQLLVKVVTSENISKEALIRVTEAFSLSLIAVPDDLPLNNAAILIEQKWLAPTATVFEQLYRALYEEGDRLTPLLYALVCARPSLLDVNYELILFVDEEFDRSLARLLLNGGKIPDEYCISILNWLWEKDESLLSDSPLVSLETLTRLSTKLSDDRQKQALLIQCLEDGRSTQAMARSVLNTFEHPDYAAFLIERSHRNIVYSDAMWQLGMQLGKSEFIRPPKLTHDNTRIRIEPFSETENKIA